MNKLLDIDHPLRLGEASKHIAGRPHVNTIRRWAGPGGYHGIRLRTFRSGRGVFTSLRFIREFQNSCSRCKAGDEAPSGHDSALEEAELETLVHATAAN